MVFLYSCKRIDTILTSDGRLAFINHFNNNDNILSIILMDKKWYFDEQKALQGNYFVTQQQQQYNTIGWFMIFLNIHKLDWYSQWQVWMKTDFFSSQIYYKVAVILLSSLPAWFLSYLVVFFYYWLMRSVEKLKCKYINTCKYFTLWRLVFPFCEFCLLFNVGFIVKRICITSKFKYCHNFL